MSLDNESGLDPPGIRVRPVTGLVAADYFAPDYFVWAVLIANLARIGYEEKTMYMVAYDWRISFQHTELPQFQGEKLDQKVLPPWSCNTCLYEKLAVQVWQSLRNQQRVKGLTLDEKTFPKESKEEDLSPAEKDHKKRVVLTGRFGSKRDQAKTCMVEEDEVMAAIKDLDGEKAPGIDAFP
ncbi:hypothetical protein IFM89_033515 [Coptis chinensis]|uniref:Uncharacterized protein n=1 Tax=Coptis chinensis TaxID=261450 RepID=A0A835H6N3_9MAGN|nr:hypothetical protein IFM89_033515 [Coptis chinensis]